jgi:hypothetical protein
MMHITPMLIITEESVVSFTLWSGSYVIDQFNSVCREDRRRTIHLSIVKGESNMCHNLDCIVLLCSCWCCGSPCTTTSANSLSYIVQ